MSRHRFTILLAALLLLLSTTPLLALLSTHPLLPEGIATVVFTIMMVSGVIAVGQRQHLYVALVLAIPTLILDITELLTHNETILCTYCLFAICFLGYTAILILRHLFSAVRITSDTIAASVCVYMIAGIIWALAYSVVEVLQPGSFEMASSNLDHADFLGLGKHKFAANIYYSLVTLSTLGYGDITPIFPLARMLSVVEALTGQMYLAVLVARLVGMHISQTIVIREANEESR